MDRRQLCDAGVMLVSLDIKFDADMAGSFCYVHVRQSLFRTRTC